MKVALIDYNAGNVQSVIFALNRLGVHHVLTDNIDEIRSADKVIFPGVGEAASTMSHLKQKGLDKLILNKQKINEDLENNWAVVAEAIQTILRRENYPEPYEALKQLTRKNSVLNKSDLHEFIDSLKIPGTVKKELKAITPFNYTGT